MGTNETRALIEKYIGFFASPKREASDLLPLLGSKFSFQGPLGTFNSAHSFADDVRLNRLRIHSVQVQDVIVDGSKASALYEIISADPEMGRIRVSEWYVVDENRIHSVVSLYDANAVKQNLARI